MSSDYIPQEWRNSGEIGAETPIDKERLSHIESGLAEHVHLDGSGGGGGGSSGGIGSPIVRSFSFAYNSPNILTGHAVYTPTVGDVLLDAWIEIDEAWDGITPLGDFGTFTGREWGWIGGNHVPLDMSLVDTLSGSTVGGLLTAAQANCLEVQMGKFTTADPVKVFVSSTGSVDDGDPGSTQGAAVLYLVTATPTSGETGGSVSASAGIPGLFGDGSDGDVVLGAGVTTLTRDMLYHDLTIPVGATLDQAGWEVFCTGTFMLDGILRSDAPDATGSDMPFSDVQGNGSFDEPQGMAGDASVGSWAPSQLEGHPGGLSGTGGTGAAGTPDLPPASPFGSYVSARSLHGRFFESYNGGGNSGIPGAGDGDTQRGGAGGAGGWLVNVWARHLVLNGTIRLRGGAGGPGETEGGATGGGGGGGGGCFMATCMDMTGTPTWDLAGGPGGAGHGGGTSGGTGQVGIHIILTA